MRIAFDAKRALLNNTGLGNYSRRVIDELSESAPDNEYILYTPRTGDEAMNRLGQLASRSNVKVSLPSGALWRSMSGLWRIGPGLTSQLKKDKIDLYHGLSNELPLDINRVGIPSVVTIHDVIFRRHPENYKPIDRAIYDYKFRKAAENATRVIAISRRTRDDLMELYGISPDKIDVIYQSCHPSFSRKVEEAEIEALRKRLNLPERYIAMVGTLEPRKNQILAVRALPQIDPEVHLVIAGRSRRDYGAAILHEADRLNVRDRVHLIPGVPFEDLPAMYHAAELTAYPSRYEGFGLPVVEAISAGTPVIAATGSCLEEAGGEGGVYVHPDDADAFAREANRLLESAGLRASMVAAGQQHIRSIMSVSMADAVLDTYRKAIRAFEG